VVSGVKGVLEVSKGPKKCPKRGKKCPKREKSEMRGSKRVKEWWEMDRELVEWQVV
jgi:hypothetical protein